MPYREREAPPPLRPIARTTPGRRAALAGLAVVGAAVAVLALGIPSPRELSAPKRALFCEHTDDGKTSCSVEITGYGRRWETLGEITDAYLDPGTTAHELDATYGSDLGPRPACVVVERWLPGAPNPEMRSCVLSEQRTPFVELGRRADALDDLIAGDAPSPLVIIEQTPYEQGPDWPVLLFASAALVVAGAITIALWRSRFVSLELDEARLELHSAMHWLGLKWKLDVVPVDTVRRVEPTIAGLFVARRSGLVFVPLPSIASFEEADEIARALEQTLVAPQAEVAVAVELPRPRTAFAHAAET